MTSDRPDPDLEALAAFADGRLAGAERDRLVEHLAGCAECRAVLAATVRVQRELAAEDRPPAAVVPLVRPGRAGRRSWLATAAVLAIAVAGLVLWQPWQRPESVVTAALAPAGEPGGLAPFIEQRWTMRGGEGPTALARSSFRLGALLVDLEAARAAADEGRTRDLGRQIGALLGAVGLMEDEAAAFRGVAEAPTGAELWRRAAEAVARSAGPIAERFVSGAVALGAGCEAGRLAAAAGRAGYFSSRTARSGLAAQLASTRDLDAELRRRLEEILAAWPSGEPSRAELETARQRFDAALRAGG